MKIELEINTLYDNIALREMVKMYISKYSVMYDAMKNGEGINRTSHSYQEVEAGMNICKQLLEGVRHHNGIRGRNGNVQNA